MGLILFSQGMNRSARRKVLITTFIIGLILKKAGIGLSVLLTFPATVLLGIPPLRFALSFWICWIIFSIIYFLRGKYGWSQMTLWVIISVLLSSAAFMSPRQYHNFYKASFYEDYIRRKYTELHSDVADMYIDRYKDKSIDKDRANELFLLAKVAQKEKQNDEALQLYNQSLDLNPDAPIVYHARGYFKLTRGRFAAELLLF